MYSLLHVHASPTIPGSSMPCLVVMAAVLLTSSSLLPVGRAQQHDQYPFSTTSIRSSCDDAAQEVGQLAEAGRLSLARSTAAKIIATEHPDCERVVARRYVEAADTMLAGWWPLGHATSTSTTGSEETYMTDKSPWAKPHPTVLLQVEPQRRDLDSMHYGMKPDDDEHCWYGDDDLTSAVERWDLCCSGLTMHHNHRSAQGSNRPRTNSNVSCHDDHSGLPFCCDFFDGSASHLRLPALREVALNIRFNITDTEHVDTKSCSTNVASCESDPKKRSLVTVLNLEQDGFLRPFDVASILWPAGYLLTLCVASPERYGVAEIRQAIDAAVARGMRDFFAIELGTGIGASSAALSLYFQSILKAEAQESSGTAQNRALVLATDTAKHALALAKANAERNNAQVDISHLDYNNRTELERIVKTYGRFPVVIGSSLQGFFDGTNDPQAPVWEALDVLLEPRNPNAIAIFCHTRSEPIEQPSDFRFRLVRRISGDDFNMKTRSGQSSDFELSLFRRN